MIIKTSKEILFPKYFPSSWPVSVHGPIYLNKGELVLGYPAKC